MKPSLDNAYERVRRAEQHLAAIKRRLPALGGPVRYWRENRQGVAAFERVVGSDITGVPAIFSILVGEGIYNLRAALDYLVYELAILDSGHIQYGTRFPIEDTEKGWKKHLATFLNGLSVEHQAAIKRLQPCAGCDWVKVLRELSDPDKHRTLTVIRLRPLVQQARQPPARRSVAMHSQVTANIAFDDGRLVTETLQELQEEIALVLDSFQPEF